MSGRVCVLESESFWIDRLRVMYQDVIVLGWKCYKTAGVSLAFTRLADGT